MILRPVALALAFLLAAALPAAAQDRTIIVLDGSGSMWGQIEGRPKLDIAREALKEVLATVPDTTELGFMAYGHREKGSCEDIELIVPPAAGTAPAIAAAADGMKFLGKTPLSAAVQRAAEDLRHTEDRATVILITDGIETCDMDPCALGSKLEAEGVDFTAHVVGFGLTAEEGQQVACLAENTGGRYIEAKDASALTDALQATVAAEPGPAPEPPPAPEPATPTLNFTPALYLAEGGPEVSSQGQSAWDISRANADGSAGENVATTYGELKTTLAPGGYVVTARLGLASVSQPVTIDAEGVASPAFVLNAGTLTMRPRGSEGGEVDPGASLYVQYPGGDTTFYGETTTVIPAGDSTITARIGAAEAVTTVSIAPGETKEIDIVAGVGVAALQTFYAEGVANADEGLFAQIVRAETAIDGTREEVANTYGAAPQFELPAGDYVAVLQLGQATAEVPFSVTVGQRTDVTALLDAGVLAVSAPGANAVELLTDPPDIAGNRTSLAYEYSATPQFTVNAGSYLLRVTKGSEVVEVKATVTAGQRTETAVP